MKITETLLSIPPYISTTWSNVISIHMEGQDLVIRLKDGQLITIPNLPIDAIERLFTCHQKFIEDAEPKTPPLAASTFNQLLAAPFRLNMGSLDSMGEVLQHNPSFAALPPLPEDAAFKIATLAKVISEEEIMAMPEPQTGCNCLYCQINRILRHAICKNETEETQRELDVTDEELRFEDWGITPLSEAEEMYLVTNKLDAHEQYRVCLKSPIGCTCGKDNCEHIIAVLRT